MRWICLGQHSHLWPQYNYIVQKTIAPPPENKNSRGEGKLINPFFRIAQCQFCNSYKAKC